MLWDASSDAIARLDSPSGQTHHIVTVYRRIKGVRTRGVRTCIHCGRTEAAIRREDERVLDSILADLRDDPPAGRQGPVDLRPPTPRQPT